MKTKLTTLCALGVLILTGCAASKSFKCPACNSRAHFDENVNQRITYRTNQLERIVNNKAVSVRYATPYISGEVKRWECPSGHLISVDVKKQ